MLKGERLQLSETWLVGDHIDGGGFGQVYEVSSGGVQRVAKFVPQVPGADRELLFTELSDVRNIVPIIDKGEYEDFWVLVMPRAEQSLRQFLNAAGGQLSGPEAITILKDICDALEDLEGKVVHRDLKPENVLLLDGRWCLADFGISRYAEATTSANTHKFSFTPPYAAPEQWRYERVTAATDIYALGVMSYELLAGRRPFIGTTDQLREEHLHGDPAPLSGVPAAFAALVDECLFKAPAARPSAANVRTRLDRVATPPASPGLVELQAANQAQVARQREVSRLESAAQSEAERRDGLADAARRSFLRISAELQQAIEDAAPAAKGAGGQGQGSWTLRLNQAELKMSGLGQHGGDDTDMRRATAFDLIAVATLGLRARADRYGYEGRIHSLWFGDIQEVGKYGWYETAFMHSPLIQRSNSQEPFALPPGGDAATALGPAMGTLQLAWPFTPLVIGALDEFIDRWARWFALAAQGQLTPPTEMPERPPAGSWRRS